jgi:uncharacterized protein
MEIEELKLKRAEIISIAERNGGRKVRIFGSLARGDSGMDSDVDFLIEMEPERSLLDIVAIKQDLEDLFCSHRRAVGFASRGPVYSG